MGPIFIYFIYILTLLISWHFGNYLAFFLLRFYLQRMVSQMVSRSGITISTKEFENSDEE